MTSPESPTPRTSGIRIWLEAGLLWIVLLVLFGANAYLAYIPVRQFNIEVHISFAIAMIVLVVVFFMEFWRFTALLRMTVLAGVFWLLFMFAITGADYFTRALH